MKKLLAMMVALMLILSVPALAETEETYLIGICQLVQHDALDAATQGFKDALTEAAAAIGSPLTSRTPPAIPPPASPSSTPSSSENVDLMHGQRHRRAAGGAGRPPRDIPILGTSVTDYGTALGIDDWTGTSGANISGTSDLAPLDQQAAMIQELFPDAKEVGLLYCSAEPNSVYQVDVITGLSDRDGLQLHRVRLHRHPTTSSAVTTNACAASDVLYIPTDNTAASCTEAIRNVVETDGRAGRRRRGGHLLRLRRGHPVHQLLRPGLRHRRNGL